MKEIQKFSRRKLLFEDDLSLEVSYSYPKGLRWECKKCASCCSDNESKKRCLLLLQTDIERLIKHKKNLYQHISGREPFVGKMMMKDKRCVFLEKNVCSVYSDRALLCRTYPFYIEQVRGVYRINYDTECPGIGNGNLLDENFFKELLELCVERRGLGRAGTCSNNEVITNP